MFVPSRATKYYNVYLLLGFMHSCKKYDQHQGAWTPLLLQETQMQLSSIHHQYPNLLIFICLIRAIRVIVTRVIVRWCVGAKDLTKVFPWRGQRSKEIKPCLERDAILANRTKSLNTPTAKQIQMLFCQFLHPFFLSTFSATKHVLQKSAAAKWKDYLHKLIFWRNYVVHS